MFRRWSKKGGRWRGKGEERGEGKKGSEKLDAEKVEEE
jgi:hypothetical protein